jgi:hypothetical protein
MKRLLVFTILVSFVMTGCMKDTATRHYTFFRPVYKTKDEVIAGIKSNAAVAIQQTGKIVVKDHYVFLNDVDKGIHVIDILDPAKPAIIAFIDIPGCVDFAVNGNYLYADCYTALVTIDITDPAQVRLKQFLNGVFPQRYYQGFIPDTSKIIREWIRVDTAVTERFSGTLTNSGDSNRFFLSAFNSMPSASAAASLAGVGISGSLARFTLLNSRLYTVSKSDLKVFNLTAPGSPLYVNSVALLQGNIETIFPYKNNLFIGAQTGMSIYDATNPDQPKKLSQFTHARACDPVIADDNYAYVTLHTGSNCAGTMNVLDVIDIKNLANSVLVKTYPLTSPQGLSKDRDLLLICDGKDGLKIFNAASATGLVLVKQVTGLESTDVITMQGLAVVIAKDGLYCIDYSDPLNARVISKIAVAQTK